MTRRPECLPVPFDPSIHRPARQGYLKAQRMAMLKAVAGVALKLIGHRLAGGRVR